MIISPFVHFHPLDLFCQCCNKSQELYACVPKYRIFDRNICFGGFVACNSQALNSYENMKINGTAPILDNSATFSQRKVRSHGLLMKVGSMGVEVPLVVSFTISLKPQNRM